MSEFKGTPGPWFWDEEGLGNKHHIVFGKGYPLEMTSKENKSLISAAPELLEALQNGQTMNLADMLEWVADRLVYVHRENENVDFVISLRERASVVRSAIDKALGK